LGVPVRLDAGTRAGGVASVRARKADDGRADDDEERQDDQRDDERDPVLSSDAALEFHDPPHARVVFRRTMSAAKRQLAIESPGVTSTGRVTLSFPSAA